MEDPSANTSIYDFDKLSEEDKSEARERYVSDQAFYQSEKQLERRVASPFNIKLSAIDASAHAAAEGDIEAMEEEYPDRYKLQIQLCNALNKLDKLLGKPAAKKMIDEYSLEYPDVRRELMGQFFKNQGKKRKVPEPSYKKISDATLDRILNKEEKNDKYANTLKDLFYVRETALSKIENLDH